MGIRGANAPTSMDIAISGLRAESMRMKVIAENIANARTTRTADGTPYRRKEVVLETGGGAAGVQVKGVSEDLSTDFKDLYMPGHPDADDAGMVKMPNVDLPAEMIQMMQASRAYQANAAILKRYVTTVNESLELLR